MRKPDQNHSRASRFAHKPTRRDNAAAAATYLVMALAPDEQTLIRSYGIKPADAAQMIADQRRKREKML